MGRYRMNGLVHAHTTDNPSPLLHCKLEIDQYYVRLSKLSYQLIFVPVCRLLLSATVLLVTNFFGRQLPIILRPRFSIGTQRGQALMTV